MSKKSTDDLFHCPFCGSTQFGANIKAHAIIQFRKGVSFNVNGIKDTESHNTVWELDDTEPSWDTEVSDLNCANEKCQAPLKEKDLLTDRQWRKKQEEAHIINKPW